MQIIIPTYRRTDRQITLRYISKKWRPMTTLVCDEEDEPHLEKYGVKIIVVPKKIQTIAQKRKWIIERWMGHKILMLDDDLRFVRRQYTRIPAFIAQVEADEVDKCFEWVDNKLDDFIHVGIAPRQGNNNIEAQQRKHGLKTPKEMRWLKNDRMIYALGYDTAKMAKVCKLGRIEHREDMDYCLQMLRAGYENRVMTEFCVDQIYAGGPGGAKLQRKIEASNADAEKLSRLHKGFVRVVDKKYLKSIPRKEVVCQWKKAYASAAAR